MASAGLGLIGLIALPGGDGGGGPSGASLHAPGVDTAGLVRALAASHPSEEVATWASVVLRAVGPA